MMLVIIDIDRRPVNGNNDAHTHNHRTEPMRISKEQAAENRERVVEAASELFRQRGFDGVAVADLMRAAGFTQVQIGDLRMSMLGYAVGRVGSFQGSFMY